MPGNRTSQLTPEQRKRRREYRRKRRIIFPISRISFLITLVLSAVFFLILRGIGVIPGKWLAVAGIILLLLNGYVAVIAISRKASNRRKLQQSIVSILMCTLMLAGSIVMPVYKGKIAKIFNPIPSEGELNINVYTLKGSQFDTASSLSGVPVAVQSRLDTEFQEFALKQLNREVKEPVVPRQCRDIYSAVDLLYEGSVGGLLLNESYVELLKENEDYRDFDDKVQLVYQCVQKVSFTYDIKEVGNITQQPFVIGILGNDESTLSSLSKTSGFRSDVNMICAVNPVTKQILVITVPRDSYVSVDGNDSYKDKLTHSPLYSGSGKSGIGYWISTINTLLDCEINYTVKVNFISVVLIINAIGGVEVDNPYEFTTKPAHPIFNEKGKILERKRIHFDAGVIHLDGSQALAYCRERYGLANGDFDRNRHQAILLRALVDRVTEPAVLTKAGTILNAMQGNFMTNLKLDEIFALAQMQMDDMAVWDVKSFAVSGTVDYQYCYQLDGEASVVSLNSSSLKKAQKYIDQIMNNERITFD